MPRFIVGETYFFVRTLFEKNDNSFHVNYHPWEDKLLSIELVSLKCESEHAVAWDQDPNGEKNNTGYIFKDDKGNTWVNQYPTASYGQLDNTQDRVVNRHFETEELLKVDSKGETLKDDEGNYIRKEGSDDLWVIFDSQFWNPFVLATYEISDMYRTCNATGDSRFVLCDAHKEQLLEHMNNIIALIEKASKKKVEFKPTSIKKIDGSTYLSNFIKAELV